jgi:ParB-like chromosome segregation protein Spo0J
MALKVNAGDDLKRGDYFFVDPFQVIVKEELRGRHKPPTDEAIIDMAESMMEHGQRQPVECRKVQDDRLMLNLGFTRTAAARVIRTGFVGSDGEKKQDAEFKLKVVISDANDEQAFKNNVVENAHRNQTSPVDDAYNQQRLRDKYGMSDAEITRLYRYKDENKVGRLRRLLGLPTPLQDQVHDGTLPIQGALDLLDLPDDKRDEAIKAAVGSNGKVVASKVREQVREHHLRDEEDAENKGSSGGTATKKKATGAKARTLREVRDFLKEESETNQDDNIKEFAKTMLLFIAGRRSKKSMHEALDTLLDAERG